MHCDFYYLLLVIWFCSCCFTCPSTLVHSAFYHLLYCACSLSWFWCPPIFFIPHIKLVDLALFFPKNLYKTSLLSINVQLDTGKKIAVTFTTLLCNDFDFDSDHDKVCLRTGRLRDLVAERQGGEVNHNEMKLTK